MWLQSSSLWLHVEQVDGRPVASLPEIVSVSSAGYQLEEHTLQRGYRHATKETNPTVATTQNLKAADWRDPHPKGLKLIT